MQRHRGTSSSAEDVVRDSRHSRRALCKLLNDTDRIRYWNTRRSLAATTGICRGRSQFARV